VCVCVRERVYPLECFRERDCECVRGREMERGFLKRVSVCRECGCSREKGVSGCVRERECVC